jgi:hypothetical protein
MYIKPIRDTLLVLFLITTVLSSIGWVYPFPEKEAPGCITEEFNPALRHLTSVDQAMRWLDSTAASGKIMVSSRAYADLVDDLVRQRFFHGYSHYSLSNDYISHLLGRILWSDLSAIVEPDHILQYDYAACSQQSIVFMALLRSKGYRTQKIGLNGHFCTGVYYDGSWHYYDSNKEPKFGKETPLPSTLELTTDKSRLYAAYSGILSSTEIDAMFGKIEINESEALPGHRVRAFHRLTGFLSGSGWAILGLGYLISFVAERFSREKYVRYRRILVVR